MLITNAKMKSNRQICIWKNSVNDPFTVYLYISYCRFHKRINVGYNQAALSPGTCKLHVLNFYDNRSSITEKKNMQSEYFLLMFALFGIKNLLQAELLSIIIDIGVGTRVSIHSWASEEYFEKFAMGSHWWSQGYKSKNFKFFWNLGHGRNHFRLHAGGEFFSAPFCILGPFTRLSGHPYSSVHHWSHLITFFSLIFPLFVFPK